MFASPLVSLQWGDKCFVRYEVVSNAFYLMCLIEELAIPTLHIIIGIYGHWKADNPLLPNNICNNWHWFGLVREFQNQTHLKATVKFFWNLNRTTEPFKPKVFKANHYKKFKRLKLWFYGLVSVFKLGQNSNDQFKILKWFIISKFKVFS